MGARLRAFAEELSKLAADNSKRPGYGAAIVAAAPLAAAQTVTEFPKGFVDKVVETAALGGKAKAREIRNLGIRASGAALTDSPAWRRGVGRAAGRLGPGLLTTPVFLSGISDIKNAKTKKDRQRGYAKILASGVSYSALKGTLEPLIEWGGTPAAWQRIKGVAGARSIQGTAAAVLTAASIAESLRSEDKSGKRGVGRRILIPAAAGAAIGAGKGVFERGWEYGVARKGGLKLLKTPEAVRGMLGGAAGRAAAGAMGGLALSEIARIFMRGKEKKSSVAAVNPPTPTTIYASVREWAVGKDDAAVAQQYEGVKGGDPERTPASRAVFYALTDELAERGVKVPKPALRDKVAPPGTMRSPGVKDLAILSGIAAAPGAVGLIAAQVEATDKDKVLLNALDQIRIQEGIEQLEHGRGFLGSFSARGGFRVEDEKLIRSIDIPKKAAPEVISHEMGHASAGNLRRLTIGHPLTSVVDKAATTLAIMLPIIAVGGINDQAFTTPAEVESRAKFLDGMGVILGVAKAPNLAEEAVSSIRGVQFMQRAGASAGRAWGGAAKVLAPAFLTYAAPAAFPFITAAYLRGKARKAREQAGGA